MVDWLAFKGFMILLGKQKRIVTPPRAPTASTTARPNFGAIPARLKLF